jgi:hypothetical protein
MAVRKGRNWVDWRVVDLGERSAVGWAAHWVDHSAWKSGLKGKYDELNCNYC